MDYGADERDSRAIEQRLRASNCICGWLAAVPTHLHAAVLPDAQHPGDPRRRRVSKRGDEALYRAETSGKYGMSDADNSVAGMP